MQPGTVNLRKRMLGMDRIISAPFGLESAEQDLGQFWGKYFAEIPMCSHEDCGRIAQNVDPFFPYLDDRNRCHEHADELVTSPAPVIS